LAFAIGHGVEVVVGAAIEAGGEGEFSGGAGGEGGDIVVAGAGGGAGGGGGIHGEDEAEGGAGGGALVLDLDDHVEELAEGGIERAGDDGLDDQVGAG